MARRWECGEKRDRGGKTTRNSRIHVWKCRLENLDLKIIPNGKGICNHNNELQIKSTKHPS